jgi:hypothetical protein
MGVNSGGRMMPLGEDDGRDLLVQFLGQVVEHHNGIDSSLGEV